jgi:hypothetical protein
MSEIRNLEQYLSDELDDLLVADGLEQKRNTRIGTPSGGNGMGMLIVIKDAPRVDLKFEIYPNETEEPHFKVTYKNTTCRFKILDCVPMKAEAKKGIPTPINKIMKQIKTVWEKNKEDIIKTWYDSRPTNQNHGHQKVL